MRLASDVRGLELHALRSGPLHRLDPRAKILGIMVFVTLVASFPKHALFPLLPCLALPLLLSFAARVPWRLLLRRLGLALPFLLVLGGLNPLLDRSPVLSVGGVVLTGGWLSFASIVLRGVLCVSAALFLVGTTSMPRLAEGARGLGLPRVLVVQLVLLQRYLSVLLEEAQRMERARALRAAGRRNPIPVAVGMLSTLLVRTLERGEAVFRAMRARGFDGRLPLGEPQRWARTDTLFVSAMVLSSLALRLWPWGWVMGA